MLRRARLFFVAAVVVAGFVLVSELPIGTLVHARAAVASAGTELSRLQRENKVLSEEVADLNQDSTIEQIAHSEYGLVEPGQRSVVVMPGGTTGSKVHDGGATGTSAPLNAKTIPKSDLVPSDAAASPPAQPTGPAGPGFWQRVLDRLEFWKASS